MIVTIWELERYKIVALVGIQRKEEANLLHFETSLLKY